MTEQMTIDQGEIHQLRQQVAKLQAELDAKDETIRELREALAWALSFVRREPFYDFKLEPTEADIAAAKLVHTDKWNYACALLAEGEAHARLSIPRK